LLGIKLPAILVEQRVKDSLHLRAFLVQYTYFLGGLFAGGL